MTPLGPFTPLTPELRARSLEEALAARPSIAPVQVFAYGSLLWRPCFIPTATVPASLADHARRFSMWTVSARGTPEQPGLGLALESAPGETCSGLVFELSDLTLADDLARLWEREMWTGVYRPAWVSVNTGGGAVDALAFVVDPMHPQYAGRLDFDTQARTIAAAAGEFGTCRDYLISTAASLARLGVEDAYLVALLERVREYVEPPTRAHKP